MLRKVYRTLRQRYIEPAFGTTLEDLSAQPEMVVPLPARRGRRLDILRSHITKESKILEIGPLARPVAARREGYNSFSADVADRDFLRRHYSHLGKQTELIEEVDFVIRDGDLLDAIPHEHRGSFDVIVASHVLEHMPDPLGFLENCAELLKPGGYVTLALPDKRFCFDLFRPPSTTAGWIDARRQGRKRHTAGALFEAATFAVASNRSIAWYGHHLPIQNITYVTMSLEVGYKEFYQSNPPEDGPYQDCHAWVFTPASFALIVQECATLDLSRLSLVSISQRRGEEFFVHLRHEKRRGISHHERLQLMALMAREQADGFKGVVPARRQTVRNAMRKLLGKI